MMSLALLLITSCYQPKARTSAASVDYSERQIDSLTFYSKHHYTNNYNFVVNTDSLCLLKQQPEEALNDFPTDSIVVSRNDILVVADIRILPTDSVDSVWVQVARDQATFGWIHESQLLPSVVPDDPISQFISLFSSTHTMIFLIVIALIAVAYLIRTLRSDDAPIVHFRDISTPYPTLLAIIVAAAATFYASIQMFAPDVWQHFYFHPTLNPFSVPPLLAIFLVCVWAMLIVAIAAIDDTFRLLPFGDAVIYLLGLAAVCAVCYSVFSITTLHYIGYPLLIVYVVFAIKRYHDNNLARYVCGNCGATMHNKGRCPHCGAIND